MKLIALCSIYVGEERHTPSSGEFEIGDNEGNVLILRGFAKEATPEKPTKAAKATEQKTDGS